MDSYILVYPALPIVATANVLSQTFVNESVLSLPSYRPFVGAGFKPARHAGRPRPSLGFARITFELCREFLGQDNSN
jgi:hypothetical protein